VLADFDLSLIKFVDFLNKRPSNHESNLCPLIPIIVLAKDNSVKDVEDHLRSVGGANKVLGQPFTSQTTFNVLLDVLYHRKQVEETFNNIKKVPIKSAKYPYLSIFEARPPLKNKDGEGETKTPRPLLSSAMHDNAVEVFDDASESSSMLPDCIRQARKDHPELRSKFEAPEKDDDVMGHSGAYPDGKASGPPGILKRQGSGRVVGLANYRQRSSRRFNFAGLDEFREDMNTAAQTVEQAEREKLVLPDECWESVEYVYFFDLY